VELLNYVASLGEEPEMRSKVPFSVRRRVGDEALFHFQIIFTTLYRKTKDDYTHQKRCFVVIGFGIKTDLATAEN
jgi:hypothetical protein